MCVCIHVCMQYIHVNVYAYMCMCAVHMCVHVFTYVHHSLETVVSHLPEVARAVYYTNTNTCKTHSCVCMCVCACTAMAAYFSLIQYDIPIY